MPSIFYHTPPRKSNARAAPFAPARIFYALRQSSCENFNSCVPIAGALLLSTAPVRAALSACQWQAVKSAASPSWRCPYSPALMCACHADVLPAPASGAYYPRPASSMPFARRLAAVVRALVLCPRAGRFLRSAPFRRGICRGLCPHAGGRPRKPGDGRKECRDSERP